jgi:hypothetical protein
MKKLSLGILALYFLNLVGVVTLTSTAAMAACPKGTAYNCETTYNGKQSCGCR